MPQFMPAPINVVNGKALGNEICMDLSSPPKP